MKLSIKVDKSNIPLTKKALDNIIYDCLVQSCKKVQETARSEHNFKTISGKLERAIKFKVIKSQKEGTIYLDTKEAKYANYVHEPTGMFREGGSRYPIRPKDPNGKLHFFWKRKGVWVTTKLVMHTGSPPDDFLQEALDANIPRIRDVFERRFTRITLVALDV